MGEVEFYDPRQSDCYDGEIPVPAIAEFEDYDLGLSQTNALRIVPRLRSLDGVSRIAVPDSRRTTRSTVRNRSMATNLRSSI